MKLKIISILNLAVFALILCSCKKFIEVDSPPTNISSKNVYDNDATASGALTSLYTQLGSFSRITQGELSALSFIAGLSADELTYYSGAGDVTLAAYYQNVLTPSNAGGGSDCWSTTYQRIYVVNAAIEGLSASTKLTLAVKRQLLGEAKFMRAFYYFYLVNLYGNIPLVLSTDYTINSVIKKSSKDQIYNQIVIDLKEAKDLLSEHFLKGDLITSYPNGSEERVRPTKWAAITLLSRVYLFMDNWAGAEEQASIVLANIDQLQLESLDKVFLKNNHEAIWQLQPTFGFNTQDADLFITPPEGPSFSHSVYLSKELLKDFEIDDRRKIIWISSVNVNGETYYYPYKYKSKQQPTTSSVTEYTTVLRLAELYLIRAESRAHLGNLNGAISDVDNIRKRAGLDLISETNPTISKESLVTLILNEKRVEFFTEWGHRWLDLKRTNLIDKVMTKSTPIKSNGGIWKNYQQYYPIWDFELQANPNLTQVQGY